MPDIDLGPGRPDAEEWTSSPTGTWWSALRASFVALLRGLDKAAWERRAPSDWTVRSVRAVAYCMAGHELHHLTSIRRQHGG